jgi:hypothetical protein
MGLSLPFVPPAIASNQKGAGLTTIELSAAPTEDIEPGSVVSLRVGGGSFHAPLPDEAGTWWFSCTDNSIVWNAADQPLMDGLDGAAAIAAIANGSRVVAIGSRSQQFRLNGVVSDGPLIYRSVGLVMIHRPEGSDIYEVTIGGGGGIGGGLSLADLDGIFVVSDETQDPAKVKFWIDTTGGGAVFNWSDNTSWFTS